jgi:hypothetical protein
MCPDYLDVSEMGMINFGHPKERSAPMVNFISFDRKNRTADSGLPPSPQSAPVA